MVTALVVGHETDAAGGSLGAGRVLVLKNPASVPMTLCLAPLPRPPASRSPDCQPSWLGHVKAAPAPTLARYVEHYWVSRWDRRGAEPHVASALLDACVHLQVRAGRAEVLGVMRGTYRLQVEGIGAVVGIRFRPAGFHPFVGQPVSAFTDRTVPAERAFAAASGSISAWAETLSRMVDDCDGGAEEHAALVSPQLDAFLEARLLVRDELADEMEGLVALLARPDVRRVRDLAQASGRSERTLHRLFLRYVGVTPAWVLRRHRLHAAAARITASPRAEVSTLACELGYADQAHLIRDFRATLGTTPGAYGRSRR